MNKKNSRLHNKDALEIMKDIPDNEVDLIVTDPPYDVATKGSGSINKVKGLNKSLKGLKEANINEGYDIELFGKEFVRIMKDINIYIWCNKTQIPKYFDFYVNQNKCKYDILRWDKTNPLPTYSNKYISDTEFCLYFKKGTNKCQPQCYEDAKTYYIATLNHKDKKKYGHPTIKPLDFTERMIRNSSKEDDIVFDPFMGSGTTGVACKKLNRKFIGCEINKEYFDIAKKRIRLGE